MDRTYGHVECFQFNWQSLEMHKPEATTISLTETANLIQAIFTRLFFCFFFSSNLWYVSPVSNSHSGDEQTNEQIFDNNPLNLYTKLEKQILRGQKELVAKRDEEERTKKKSSQMVWQYLSIKHCRVHNMLSRRKFSWSWRWVENPWRTSAPMRQCVDEAEFAESDKTRKLNETN